MGRRGPERKHTARKRGFPKKVLTEEELRNKISKIRDRKAARKRDHSKEWKSRLEREKLLPDEERKRRDSARKTRDKLRYLTKRAKQLRKDNKAISKSNKDICKILEPATPEAESK